MSRTVILWLNFYTGSFPQNVMINFIKLLTYTDLTIQTFQEFTLREGYLLIKDLLFIKGRGIYRGHFKNICLLRGSKVKNWKSLSALGKIPHKTIEQLYRKMIENLLC